MIRKNFFNDDMRRTMLRFRILSRVSRSQINPYALLKELTANPRFAKRFGSNLVIRNEVYNALKSLENAGYLKATLEKPNGNGRVKNYYAITKEGKDVLKSAKSLMAAHMREMSAMLGE